MRKIVNNKYIYTEKLQMICIRRDWNCQIATDETKCTGISVISELFLWNIVHSCCDWFTHFFGLFILSFSCWILSFAPWATLGVFVFPLYCWFFFRISIFFIDSNPISFVNPQFYRFLLRFNWVFPNSIDHIFCNWSHPISFFSHPQIPNFILPHSQLRCFYHTELPQMSLVSLQFSTIQITKN